MQLAGMKQMLNMKLNIGIRLKCYDNSKGGGLAYYSVIRGEAACVKK